MQPIKSVARIAVLCLCGAAALGADPANVIVRRDQWGVPHIHGRTHADAFFGMGYAQAEDYFFQLEDTCLQALGRYAEVKGQAGLRSDILNRSFQIASRSRNDFNELKPEHQAMAAAFAAGVNHYLQTHPKEKPRLLDHFEPWYVIAMDRHMLLHFVYGRTHAGKPVERKAGEVAALHQHGTIHNAWDADPARVSNLDLALREAIGSNAWAISGSRTESGAAMLFVNPHQPWYGMGQFYEAHLSSGEGLNFSGGCFYGNPFPTIGHNEFLGWTYTVNEPDNADAWRVRFDHPTDPLKYRYDVGWRTAEQWVENIGVREGKVVTDNAYTFRRTHHGPIVRRDGDHLIAAQVAGIFNLSRVDQALGMVLAKDYQQWRKAISHCAIPLFNVVYADRAGNIFYAFNGTIPRRDPQFDWTHPVDGSLPEADWKGIHSFDELPQVLNPSCGYVQSCNSSPFTTCDVEKDNPDRKQFPAYMLEDADKDLRRSKMSRWILSQAKHLTFDDLQTLAFDSRLYWAMTEIPALQDEFRVLGRTNAGLAAEISECWRHLSEWDYRSSVECTRTAVVVAWYEELFGVGYPAETLKSEYRDRSTWFQALKKAQKHVAGVYGTWKPQWGETHRLQRIKNQPDTKSAAFSLNTLLPSIPCAGTPGPLGIINTVYSSPEIPIVRPRRFALVGPSYLSVVEFTGKVNCASLVPFGASGRPRSPHFFDQAKLYSESRLKPAWFYPGEVASKTKVVLDLGQATMNSSP